MWYHVVLVVHGIALVVCASLGAFGFAYGIALLAWALEFQYVSYAVWAVSLLGVCYALGWVFNWLKGA